MLSCNEQKVRCEGLDDALNLPKKPQPLVQCTSLSLLDVVRHVKHPGAHAVGESLPNLFSLDPAFLAVANELLVLILAQKQPFSPKASATDGFGKYVFTSE